MFQYTVCCKISIAWTKNEFPVFWTWFRKAWASYWMVCLQAMMASIEFVTDMDTIAMYCFRCRNLGYHHYALKYPFSGCSCTLWSGADATRLFLSHCWCGCSVRCSWFCLLLLLHITITFREKQICTFLITCCWFIFYIFEFFVWRVILLIFAPDSFMLCWHRRLCWKLNTVMRENCLVWKDFRHADCNVQENISYGSIYLQLRT